MERPIALSSRTGEIVAPQTMVTALIVSPDGTAKLDPGVLHGRSELETGLRMVPKRELVLDPEVRWVVWIALELDAANQPLHYKGLSVAELWVNLSQRLGYKSLAQQVNRMSEAMRGTSNAALLSAQARQSVKQQLVSLSQDLWDRSPDSLKQALQIP